MKRMVSYKGELDFTKYNKVLIDDIVVWGIFIVPLLVAFVLLAM